MLLSYLLCISFQAINLHALHNQHGLYADTYFKTRDMGVGMTREFLYVERVHFCTYWKSKFLICSMRISPDHEIYNSKSFCQYYIRRPGGMLHIIENRLYVIVKIMKELMKVLMKALMKECYNDDTTHIIIYEEAFCSTKR